MKKLLGLAALLLAVNTTAFAAVTTTEENYSLEMKYPVVELANQAAADRINSYYAKDAEKFRKEVYKASHSQAATNYEVKYEDDNYLAVATTYWHYDHGAAHGIFFTDAKVFDKETGKALPLKHFLPKVPSAKVLDQAIREGKLPFYSVNNPKPLEQTSFFGLKYISDSYFIDKDNNVYLLYAPYDLSSYAAGTTMVKLNPEIVANLEAK